MLAPQTGRKARLIRMVGNTESMRSVAKKYCPGPTACVVPGFAPSKTLSYIDSAVTRKDSVAEPELCSAMIHFAKNQEIRRVKTISKYLCGACCDCVRSLLHGSAGRICAIAADIGRPTRFPTLAI